jgi:tight adherence protein C
MLGQYSELFWLSAIFLLALTLTFSLVYRFSGNRRTRERLLVKGDETGSKPELALGEMTEGLAAQVPMREETKSDLQKELLAAGFYRKSALTNYAAIRTLLTILPILVAGVVAALSDNSQLVTILIVGALAAMLGYSLPRIFLVLRGRMRSRAIERGLPVAVDMLTLCLSAGQNILAAIQRVSTELKFSHRVLSDELEIVRQQAELRNLQHALQQFAERVQVPEVRNLAMILIQSERLGTDAAATLLEYSQNLRTTLRQRADAKANRTMFWMLFPTLLCLWIPAGIVLIGPAVLEFQSYRRGGLQQWKDAKRELQELKDASQRAITPAPTVTPEQPVSQ